MKKKAIGSIARIVLYILLPVLAFVLTVAVVSAVHPGNQAKNNPASASSTKEDPALRYAREGSVYVKSLEDISETASTGAPSDPENDEVLPEDPDSSSAGDSEASSDSSSETSSDSDSEDESYTLTAYLVRVNLATNVITVFTYDENSEYTIPVKAMLCSPGDEIPAGDFTMGSQSRWNDQESGEIGQYASQISGDVLFHSVLCREQDPSTVLVNSYNQLGTTCPGRCIQVTTGDAYWIFCNCTAYDTRIEIGWFDSDPLGKPAVIQLPASSEVNWDPTDPDSANPWSDYTPVFTGIPDDITVVQGSELPDLKEGVMAFDTCGNLMSYYSVDSDADTNTVGTYSVTYYCMDVLGRTAEVTVPVYVTEPEESAESE